MTEDERKKRFPVDGKDCWISELHVMQSAAGYYIGRDCIDKTDPFGPEPYSRESDYFRTEEGARAAMGSGFIVRDCVENNFAYDSGIIPKPPARPATASEVRAEAVKKRRKTR